MAEPEIAAGDRLRVQEEALRFAQVGLYRYRFDGTILDMNEAAFDIIGLRDRFSSPADVIGRNIEDLIVYVGPRRRLRDLIRKQGEARNVLYPFRTLAGVEKWALHDSFLTVDPTTGEQVIQAIIKDVTEAQKAQETLRESEERLARVVETVPDGITIVGRDGRVNFANSAAEGILGLAREDILRRTYNDPAWQITGVDGKPFPEDGLPFVRVMRTGEPVYGVEHAIICPDGKRVVLSINAGPLRDAAGAVVGVITSLTDITERKAAEAERARLLAELEATVESAPAGVVTYDPSGSIVRMNAAAAQIMSYSPSDLALPAAELVARLRFETDDGRSLPLEEFPPVRALRGEKVAGVAIAFHRGDRKVWIYDGAGPIRARDGTILGAVASFVNITELRELQDKQRQLLAQLEARAAELTLERDRLRTLVESIADAVFVCDAQGTITLANAAGLALIGEAPGEARRTLADYLSALQLRYPDGRPLPQEELAITRALSGVTERGREEVGVHPRTHERIHLLISAAPLRDASGQVVGAVEVAADITRVTELGDVAQRRAAELQGVLDNMVDAVFVCASDGRIILTNAAATRLFGVPSFADVRSLPAEFPARFHLRHPDGRPILPSEMATARALAGQTVVDADQVLHNPRLDQDRYIRVSAAPIRDAQGRTTGAVVVARDVTELTELDRLKDQFISVAAHELKTPVTIMKGYAQTLLQTESVPPAQRRMLQAIDRGANRIDRIVRDLLDISQLHLGSLRLTKERADLAELVAVAVDRIAPTTGKHRVRVVKAEPVVVEADRGRLEEVLAILLDNAIRYSPQGGDVDVALAVRDGGAVVSVRDQGVGIPRAKQARIFERFYRAHTGTPYDYGGMGVGLYIAREIVLHHGGTIWFESQEGKGSTFHFSLPLATGGKGSGEA